MRILDTDRLIIADGVDLCTKHDSCESEEEDCFETQEDQQQHRHPWGEVTALWSQEGRKKGFYFVLNKWNVKWNTN